MFGVVILAFGVVGDCNAFLYPENGIFTMEVKDFKEAIERLMKDND